jgi:menaquinone-specific isochorismate synthase
MPTAPFPTIDLGFSDLLDYLRSQLHTCGPEVQLISLTLPMSDQDPLAALSGLGDHETLFYWEQADQGLAIAAAGRAASIELTGPQRFEQSQAFIETCLRHTRVLPWEASDLRFCSSFGFSADSRDPQPPFAPATLFLPRWQLIREGDHTRLTINLSLEGNPSPRELSERIWSLRHRFRRGAANLPEPVDNRWLEQQSSDRERFRRSVEQALEAIGRGQLEKVVLARTLDGLASSPFQLAPVLDRLRRQYPDCTVFGWGNGQGSLFLGASPERLVRLQQGEVHTEALAGTAPRHDDRLQDLSLGEELSASPKDLHEHELVAAFICEQLQQLGLNPRRAIAQPQLRRLSTLQHLQTPIQARQQPGVTLLDLVERLHPTPAVAGLPRPAACQLLRQQEGFERGLYAAPIGWIDARGDGEFIVGIRSALLQGRRARLYAGAGIVAGSRPEQECREVDLKLRSLLEALI